jgi:hypothetical protein
MYKSVRAKAVTAALVCVVVGASAGIVGSAAAPSKDKPSRSAQGNRPGPPGPRHGPPIHAELVVPNKAGDGFVDVTIDTGTVESVSGDQLTIKQGTKSATYKTITLTIPSDAKIHRNMQEAQLSDLKAGDKVHVARSSEGTFVGAHDKNHGPRPGKRGGRGERGGPGGPGFGGPPGPPPAD